MEANLNSALELVEAVEEKTQVQEQSLSKVREQISQRFQGIQKQLIETLTAGSASNDYQLSFQAYEESIDKLENEMTALKKDFVVFRDRTNVEVQQGVEMIRQTREDYIKRIQDIYDDQARIVRETQNALNTTRDSVENQSRQVSNDNKVNSKMLMTFENSLSN